MTSDLLINLLATGIAFVLGLASRSVHGRIKVKRATSRELASRERRHPRYSAAWLVNYYRARGAEGSLFVADHGGRRQTVPFLVKPSWITDGMTEDVLLDQQVPHRLADVPVDEKVLIARGRYLAVSDEGGEPWNELLACAAGLSETDHGPRVRLTLARYFQYLSACGPIEDETYAAIARPSRATPLRDRFLSDADTAASCGRGAHAFGMQVATVFDTGSQHLVLVQRRSHAVSIYGGALAVVPVFGCQSLDLSERTPISLDLGCGGGYLVGALAGLGVDAVGVDGSAYAIEQAKRRFAGRFEHARIDDFSAGRQGCFSVVTMMDVIEHVPNPVAALRVAAALVAPGGVLVVLTPRYGGRLLARQGPAYVHFNRDHMFYFTEDTLRNAIERAGVSGDLSVVDVLSFLAEWRIELNAAFSAKYGRERDSMLAVVRMPVTAQI